MFPLAFVSWFQAKKVWLILGAVVLACLVFVVNDYLDTKAQLRTQTAIASTNSELMRKLGDAVVAQGNVLQSEKELRRQADEVMGRQVTSYMEANNAAIRALYTAIGRVEASIRAGGPVTVLPGADGSFKNVTLTQARPTPAPALAQVALNYDPAAPDPTKRLTSTWTNYREDFHPSLGEWAKKDGGFVAAFKLRREVFRPDPTAAGGMVKVGDEVIDVGSANATYSPVAFPDSAAQAVPRWSIMGGFGRDIDLRKNSLVGILGYQVTPSVSVHGGAVGSTAIIGASWHFSLGK